MTPVAVAAPTVRRVAPAAPPVVHRFDSPSGHHLLVVDRSQVFDVDRATAERFDGVADDPIASQALLDELRGPVEPVDLAPPVEPPLRAISLNVAQACNLGCSYCYADGGSFGGDPVYMDRGTAIAAVDRLLDGCHAGERASIAFMGGEPLLARSLIRDVTAHARRRAIDAGVELRLAVTTNGTLLRPDDVAFFTAHRFAVTVSIDGGADVHDALRPDARGRGTWDEIVGRLGGVLGSDDHGLDLAARVTITRHNLDLPRVLRELTDVGFRSVGCSPMLTGHPDLALRPADLDRYLTKLRIVADEFADRALRGERHAFSTLGAALHEVHRGTHRPYPCGAGAGYLNVGASGDLFACHRFSDDPVGRLGGLAEGVDTERQADWLAARHVDAQQPCGGCWARYLCGGGCHHEVLAAGRTACDFIRGWLDVVLATYVRIDAGNPAWFAHGSRS